MVRPTTVRGPYSAVAPECGQPTVRGPYSAVPPECGQPTVRFHYGSAVPISLIVIQCGVNIMRYQYSATAVRQRGVLLGRNVHG